LDADAGDYRPLPPGRERPTACDAELVSWSAAKGFLSLTVILGHVPRIPLSAAPTAAWRFAAAEHGILGTSPRMTEEGGVANSPSPSPSPPVTVAAADLVVKALVNMQ
jgi:hypothetical protein